MLKMSLSIKPKYQSAKVDTTKCAIQLSLWIHRYSLMESLKSGLGDVPVTTLLIAWCVLKTIKKSADIEHT